MRVLRVGFTVALLSSALATGTAAQDQQTLADIRQELTVLYVEVQKLKRELSTTGGPSVNVTGDSVLERVAAMESELQRLTAKSEQLENRVNRVVTDGTNRIGDLEFRLVELEGGDVSKLGETTTLGGDAGTSAPAVATPPPAGTGVTPGSELAVGEEADYQAATQALESGDNARAAELFAQFNQSYPGSPLAARAELNRGRALAATGDMREAARAFLASFSADGTGPDAPVALYELGAALGTLGQTSQACLTLAEVGVRFPSSGMVSSAQQEMAALGCS
ncbi:tol-pal system protein YbgF [Sedimentitalea sp. XS_ASV28]|uniref:tol-pal system protein YbgF n=1 Tax=Sedimentitalea sp. XS_ASV28 TaxID=3241296 RepID=UPI003513F4F5